MLKNSCWTTSSRNLNLFQKSKSNCRIKCNIIILIIGTLSLFQKVCMSLRTSTWSFNPFPFHSLHSTPRRVHIIIITIMIMITKPKPSPKPNSTKPGKWQTPLKLSVRTGPTYTIVYNTSSHHIHPSHNNNNNNAPPLQQLNLSLSPSALLSQSEPLHRVKVL